MTIWVEGVASKLASVATFEHSFNWGVYSSLDFDLVLISRRLPPHCGDSRHEVLVDLGSTDVLRDYLTLVMAVGGTLTKESALQRLSAGFVFSFFAWALCLVGTAGASVYFEI